MVSTTKTNKPINPRGNDQSPLAFNRAKLYSGKALDFDGVNDIVTTTYTSGFTGAQEFTYCAYINADNITSNQSIIHGNETTGYGLQSLQVRTDNNGIRFFAGTGSSSTSYVDSETIEANKWYFVVGVHTPTENKIYLNGVLNATATGGNLTTAPSAITIGAYPGFSVAFNGEIANAKIFNTALTAAQVADLYNNPEKVVPTGVDNTALKLWLPMMEGAGTTAYDGSGNGNHGTISGATYTHGIGAPVSQTAVIDWNKGTNKITYSEDFSQSVWTKGQVNIESGYTAPDGSATAYKVTYDDTFANLFGFSGQALGTHKSIWAKTTSGTGTTSLMNRHNESSSVFTITNEWQRFDVAHSGGDFFYAVDMRGGGLTEVILWGAQMVDSATEVTPYIPTHGTAQTSPVLLPQGLTSGRDITGVNLFENVRKQGALNLDGNSWAEVHDNASLDITSEITLEAWVYWDGVQADKGILGKWRGSDNLRGYLLYVQSSTEVRFFVSPNGVASSNVETSTTILNGWNHLVGVYDGTNIITYLNGTADGSTAYSSGLFSSSLPLEIGRFKTDSNAAYENQIAQPRIYNRALTAEEVQRSYDSGKNIFTNS